MYCRYCHSRIRPRKHTIRFGGWLCLKVNQNCAFSVELLDKCSHCSYRPAQFNDSWSSIALPNSGRRRVRFYFLIQTPNRPNAAKNNVEVEQYSQITHTTVNTTGQHITIGQCFFEANRAEFWQEEALNHCWTVGSWDDLRYENSNGIVG
jgi:hypothetical protein